MTETLGGSRARSAPLRPPKRYPWRRPRRNKSDASLQSPASSSKKTASATQPSQKYIEPQHASPGGSPARESRKDKETKGEDASSRREAAASKPASLPAAQPSRGRNDFDAGAAGRVASFIQKKSTEMIFPHSDGSVAESRKDKETSDPSGSSSSREAATIQPVSSVSSNLWMAGLFPSGSDAEVDTVHTDSPFGTDAWATEVAMTAAVDEGVKKVFDNANDDPPVWVAGLFPSGSDADAEAKVEAETEAGADKKDWSQKVFDDATSILKDIKAHERATSIDSLEEVLGAVGVPEEEDGTDETLAQATEKSSVSADEGFSYYEHFEAENEKEARKKLIAEGGTSFEYVDEKRPLSMYDLAGMDVEKNPPRIEKEAKTTKEAKPKKAKKKLPRKERKPSPTIMDLDALGLNINSRFERMASSVDGESLTDEEIEASIDFVEEMDIAFGGKAFDAFAEFMADRWDELVGE